MGKGKNLVKFRYLKTLSTKKKNKSLGLPKSHWANLTEYQALGDFHRMTLDQVIMEYNTTCEKLRVTYLTKPKCVSSRPCLDEVVVFWGTPCPYPLYKSQKPQESPTGCSGRSSLL